MRPVQRSVVEAARLAETIASDYYAGKMGDAFPGPAARAVATIEPNGPGRRSRLFLTFVSVVNRMRDAARLWRDALSLFESRPDVFEPARIRQIPLATLQQTLSDTRVSRFHGPDSEAWRRVAVTLATIDSPVRRLIEDGSGDAEEVLRALRGRGSDRQTRFPQLRGAKIGPMWVRFMAYPGGATVRRIGIIPVAVDVQVRRVTEALGVTDTRGLHMRAATPVIQDAWRRAVCAGKVPGPPGLAGTSAALDPALWSFGVHGCGPCHEQKIRTPISAACDSCVLPFPLAAITNPRMRSRRIRRLSPA